MESVTFAAKVYTRISQMKFEAWSLGQLDHAGIVS